MSRDGWRDAAEEVLYAYTDIADRKDLPAVVALLGAARVEFPTASASDPGEVERLYRSLWAAPHPHRHVVTNVRIHADGAGSCTATALYTRWSLEPDPVITTLGAYELRLSVREGVVGVDALTVRRQWHREA